MNIFNEISKKIDAIQHDINKHFEARSQYHSQSGTDGLDVLFNSGASGEFRTYKIVSHFSESNLCIANCYIPKKDGTFSEIDVIMIHPTGIYVFESKNYSGYIFGSENNPNWTVTLHSGYGNVEKHHFYNPILQNQSHINYLRKYLASDIPMYSYIIFSNRCSFKKLSYDSSKVCVCHREELKRILEHDIAPRAIVLDNTQMSELFSILDRLSHKSSAEKSEHIQSISQKQASALLCPKCNGRLLLRTAKRGPNAGTNFYGCSNYPKCTYTRNIL